MDIDISYEYLQAFAFALTAAKVSLALGRQSDNLRIPSHRGLRHSGIRASALAQVVPVSRLEHVSIPIGSRQSHFENIGEQKIIKFSKDKNHVGRWSISRFMQPNAYFIFCSRWQRTASSPALRFNVHPRQTLGSMHKFTYENVWKWYWRLLKCCNATCRAVAERERERERGGTWSAPGCTCLPAALKRYCCVAGHRIASGHAHAQTSVTHLSLNWTWRKEWRSCCPFAGSDLVSGSVLFCVCVCFFFFLILTTNLHAVETVFWALLIFD